MRTIAITAAVAYRAATFAWKNCVSAAGDVGSAKTTAAPRTSAGSTSGCAPICPP